MSFMVEDSPTYGSVQTTDLVKRKLAEQSLRFNVEKCDEWFHYLFPNVYEDCRRGIQAKEEAEEEERKKRETEKRYDGETRLNMVDAAENEAAEVAAAGDGCHCCLVAEFFLFPFLVFFCVILITLLILAFVVSIA